MNVVPDKVRSGSELMMEPESYAVDVAVLAKSWRKVIRIEKHLCVAASDVFVAKLGLDAGRRRQARLHEGGIDILRNVVILSEAVCCKMELPRAEGIFVVYPRKCHFLSNYSVIASYAVDEQVNSIAVEQAIVFIYRG